jgi:glycosyltransferase involved in cell wall biosynthesis
MPNISIIIPTYNDPDGIDQTLHSLTRQTYSRYEILPVDNNSTDDTPQVIEKWAARYPNLIRPLIEQSVQSSYAARNTGIEAAAGDLLVFIDADMTASPTWLQHIHAAVDETAADYLGYEIEVYIPDGEESLWGYYDQAMGLPARYFYEEKQFVPTACLAVRANIFDKVGPFDATLASGGDKEFGQRVFSHPDLTTAFADEIVVRHPARTTFAAHYKKAVRIGRGLARLQGGRRDRSSILLELCSYALPPNPVRIYEVARPSSIPRFLFLYAANTCIRYLRLYGALSTLWAPKDP